MQETERYPSGKVRFAVDGKDSAGSTVRIVVFKEELCRRFSSIFKIGKVFNISKFNMSPANKAFSKMDSEFEINLYQFSQVDHVDDSNSTIPKLKKTHYINISEASEKPVGHLINMVAVIKSVEEFQENPKEKRIIILEDINKHEVTLTLWGRRHASKFNGEEKQVIVINDVIVSSFEGFSLSANNNSQIKYGENLPKNLQEIQDLLNLSSEKKIE